MDDRSKILRSICLRQSVRCGLCGIGRLTSFGSAKMPFRPVSDITKLVEMVVSGQSRYCVNIKVE